MDQPIENRATPGNAKSRNALAIVFRLLLALLFLATLNGLFFLIAQRAEFETLFPGAGGRWHYVLIVAYVVGLVPVVGLFFWKRWAVPFFLITGITLVSFDFAVKAPTQHKIASTTTTIVILLLSFALRKRFTSSLD